MISILYYFKQKKRNMPKMTEKKSDGNDTKIVGTNISDNNMQLHIYFPDMPESFPDVWGVNDELSIKCVLKEGNLGVPDAPINIQLEDGQSNIIKTNNDGIAHIFYTFTKKGEYVIKVTYEADGNRLTGTKSLRIVSYREESILLFNSLLKKIEEKGIIFPQSATPRLIEKQLLKMNLDENIVTHLIMLFEEAEYSNHEFNREKYERMYLYYTSIIKDVNIYERKNDTED